MAISFSNFPENPLYFQKFKKNPKNLNFEKPKKINPKNHSTLKSFWAFLSSIIIYISIFYIFNLSPSTLFHTTKFWFFISNTLVLIIAADFVAFSSSKEHDYYEEYVEKSSKSATVPSFDDKIVEKTMASNDMKEEENPHEKIINIVDDQITEHELEILNSEEKYDDRENPNQEESVEKEREKNEEKREAKCVRSNSDKAIITAALAEEEREERMVLQRTLSERHEEQPRLEENEFSRMSDEELNRRVEEFIRRFNMQIRLQAAARNRRNSDMNSV